MKTKTRSLCPECKEREKELTRNGKRLGYCKICYNERKRKYYYWRTGGREAPAKRGYSKRINQFPQGKSKPICPRCKLRERRVYSTGTIGAYCKQCDNKDQKTRYHKNTLIA